MAKLKPCISTTQSLHSIPNHTLPIPISKFNINFHLLKPKSVAISQSHQTLTNLQIVCARRPQWPLSSNRKLLQLVSTLAFNLKILPEPFNSLVREIAQTNSNEHRIVNRLISGWSRKTNKSSKRRNEQMFLLPLFVLICVAGFWAFRVSELDLFLKSLFFCFVGVSSISLLRNKVIKDWFLGFFLGAVLMMSFRLGKEDVKFWVEKFRTCSPVAQIALKNRNRKWKVSK
ncbi:hypothetical protein MtrunA17_Chr1g0191701 [Medicago truncatula]|uniref:Transmembrane protein, putative n=1 Tax=Medicago truncatula TaxID=3880 RepID=G7I816_MEDTR|nr:transmembrane protein, putative [Medicago truncatula]RHN80755.1 hypothetical protein MtrunA17_Chr1g0191701 [Medicago truncatula]